MNEKISLDDPQLTQGEAETTNWRAVASVYRKRIHSICLYAAFLFYAALGVGAAKIFEWLHVDPVWVESITLFIWLPLGIAAYYAKNLLEDLADKDLPQP